MTEDEINLRHALIIVHSNKIAHRGRRDAIYISNKNETAIFRLFVNSTSTSWKAFKERWIEDWKREASLVKRIIADKKSIPRVFSFLPRYDLVINESKMVRCIPDGHFAGVLESRLYPFANRLYHLHFSEDKKSIYRKCPDHLFMPVALEVMKDAFPNIPHIGESETALNSLGQFYAEIMFKYHVLPIAVDLILAEVFTKTYRTRGVFFTDYSQFREFEIHTPGTIAYGEMIRKAVIALKARSNLPGSDDVSSGLFFDGFLVGAELYGMKSMAEDIQLAFYELEVYAIPPYGYGAETSQVICKLSEDGYDVKLNV